MAKKRVLSSPPSDSPRDDCGLLVAGIDRSTGAPDAYAGQAFVPYDEFSGDGLLPGRWFAKTTIGTTTSGPQILSIGREVRMRCTVSRGAAR